jgi:hypothetical protein
MHRMTTPQILTRTVRAEELPTRLAGVALFVNLFTDLAEVKDVKDWDIWHPVADASVEMVEGKPSVTVRFSDGTPDVTFNALEQVDVATLQNV